MWLAIYKPRKFSLSWITNWVCSTTLYMVVPTCWIENWFTYWTSLISDLHYTWLPTHDSSTNRRIKEHHTQCQTLWVLPMRSRVRKCVTSTHSSANLCEISFDKEKRSCYSLYNKIFFLYLLYIACQYDDDKRKKSDVVLVVVNVYLIYVHQKYPTCQIPDSYAISFWI